MQLTNIPEVKLGLVAVSRDCFPVALITSCTSALSRWKTSREC